MNRVDKIALVVSLCLWSFNLALAGALAAHFLREPAPKPQIERTLSLPEQCAHLYNVGRHNDWADCMGVGYK